MIKEESSLCEACGVTAEMGYVIGEGDEIAEVIIFADTKESALTEFHAYASLAHDVNEKVVHNFDEQNEFEFAPLTVKFKFECSAEKIIFELRSRSLLK